MRRLLRPFVTSVVVHAAVVAGVLIVSPSARVASPNWVHVDLRATAPATQTTSVRIVAPSKPGEARAEREDLRAAAERDDVRRNEAPSRPAPRPRPTPAPRPVVSPRAPRADDTPPAADTPPSAAPSAKADVRADGPIAPAPEGAAEGHAAGSTAIDPALDLRVRPSLPPPSGPPGLEGLGEIGASPEPKTGGARFAGPGRYQDSRIVGEVHADGSLSVRDSARVRPKGSGVSFDLGDEMMRVAGQDPFGYDKMKFERETRALRNALRDEACREDLRAAVEDIRPRLVAIWRDTRRSTPEKRRAVFKVWEDCAEDGDPEVLAASGLVREIVLDFIAANLPAGSALAYTPHEVRALNAGRHARAEFVPYHTTDISGRP